MSEEKVSSSNEKWTAFFERGLAPKAENRFASANDMKDDLTNLEFENRRHRESKFNKIGTTQ